MKPALTVDVLKTEARRFAAMTSARREPSLYGVTDGKAIGAYMEHRFREYLRERYEYVGASAEAVDGVDRLI